MTQLQGWILLGMIAAIAGWSLSADMASMQSKANRALQQHCELMARIDGRGC